GYRTSCIGAAIVNDENVVIGEAGRHRRDNVVDTGNEISLFVHRRDEDRDASGLAAVVGHARLRLKLTYCWPLPNHGLRCSADAIRSASIVAAPIRRSTSCNARSTSKRAF